MLAVDHSALSVYRNWDRTWWLAKVKVFEGEDSRHSVVRSICVLESPNGTPYGIVALRSSLEGEPFGVKRETKIQFRSRYAILNVCVHALFGTSDRRVMLCQL